MKTKKNRKKILFIVLGAIVAVITGFAAFMCIGFGLKDANIKNIDVSKVPDGAYIGELTGSRFGNKLRVMVSSGRITDIVILKDLVFVVSDVSSTIFSEVEAKQSLQVDCVSGATVSSKAYLKSIENALESKSQA